MLNLTRSETRKRIHDITGEIIRLRTSKPKDIKNYLKAHELEQERYRLLDELGGSLYSDDELTLSSTKTE